MGEKAARLKLNGHLLARSPLSSLEELEMLRLGVEGKAAGWRTLGSWRKQTSGGATFRCSRHAHGWAASCQKGLCPPGGACARATGSIVCAGAHALPVRG
jgi:hypothetical protein